MITVIVLPLFLIGYSTITSEEIGRIEMNKVSTNDNFIVKEAALDLKKGGEITFWSDMGIEYEDNVKIRFRIKILKNDYNG